MQELGKCHHLPTKIVHMHVWRACAYSSMHTCVWGGLDPICKYAGIQMRCVLYES